MASQLSNTVGLRGAYVLLVSPGSFDKAWAIALSERTAR